MSWDWLGHRRGLAEEAPPDAEWACFLKPVTICAFKAEISGRCHNAGGRQVSIPRTQALEVPVGVKED